MRYCILTNDVELTSIVNNNLSLETGKRVLDEGLPKLLNLYANYNIKATFFITGKFIESFPEVIKIIDSAGHEIASHGYRHEVDQAFDTLSLDEQVKHLNLSKALFSKYGLNDLVSFRAPALRTNEFTAQALNETGFRFDSSIASQRFDFFLSFGGLKKLKWLFAPRKPFYTQEKSLLKKGKSNIFEIPVSALLVPYVGTTMRVFPVTTRIMRFLLHIESCITGKPVVFLIHPIEVITEKRTGEMVRRSKNFIKYLLTDKLRRFLKLRNLGDKALNQYEEEIKFFKSRNYKFVTIREYGEIYGKSK